MIDSLSPPLVAPAEFGPPAPSAGERPVVELLLHVLVMFDDSSRLA